MVALVASRLLNTPVDGVEAPIGVPSIDPPVMVRLPATMASVIESAGREMVESTVKLLVLNTVELAYVLLVYVEETFVAKRLEPEREVNATPPVKVPPRSGR